MNALRAFVEAVKRALWRRSATEIVRPLPTLADVRCPNCEERFVLVGAQDRDAAVRELSERVYRHFLAEHPGQFVGEGTTRTA